jgi:hypothetical protein
MKTRIVKHNGAEFNLNSWRTQRPTWYTVEYKTWLGWKPVYTYLPPLRVQIPIECPHLQEAKKLKKYVDETGRVLI